MQSFNQKIDCLSESSKESKSSSGFFSGLYTKISTSITSSFSTLPTFQSIKQGVANTLKSLKNTFYDATVTNAEKLTGKAKDDYIKAKKLLQNTTNTSSCTKTKENNNIVAEISASPSTNDTTLSNKSQEYSEKRLIEDSKSQDLTQQLTVVESIQKDITKSGIPEIREKTRQLQGIHPIIDNSIKNLPIFQPASEYIGSWIIGYTLDKPSLQLKNWNDGTPKPIRKNIAAKLNNDTVLEIEKVYTITNKKLYDNLPKEYYTGSSHGLGVTHAFHIAGDFSYYTNHINNIVGDLAATKTANSIGDLIYLLNYINTVNEEISVENIPNTIISEDYEVVVDNRQNIIRQPIETIDNIGLIPVKS